MPEARSRFSAVAFLWLSLAVATMGLLATCGGGGGQIPPAAQTASAGISLFASGVGDAFELGLDADANVIVVRYETVNNEPRAVARKFAADGTSVPFGPGGQGVVLPGQASAGAKPQGLTGVALDGLGNIYFSTATYRSNGSGNSFAVTGGSISKTTPDGQTVKLVDWPEGGPSIDVAAGASAPAYVALGPDGTLYFVDLLTGNLMKWTAQAGAKILAPLRPPLRDGVFFARNAWIRADSSNKIYVMDRFLLKRLESGAFTVVAGSTSLPSVEEGGGSPGTQDGVGSQASFAGPTGLAIDTAGDLYVADREVIRKVTAAGAVSTAAGQRATGTSTFDYAPFRAGELPGSLGFRVGPIAIELDKLLHVIVYSQVPNPNPKAPVQPNRLLAKIKLP